MHLWRSQHHFTFPCRQGAPKKKQKCVDVVEDEAAVQFLKEMEEALHGHDGPAECNQGATVEPAIPVIHATEADVGEKGANDAENSSSATEAWRSFSKVQQSSYVRMKNAFLKRLDVHRGESKVLTKEMLDATMEDIKASISGATPMERLEKVVHERSIVLSPLCVNGMLTSPLVKDVHQFARLRDENYELLELARALTKDNSKNKHQDARALAGGMGVESFQDKLNIMNKIVVHVKNLVIPIVGLDDASSRAKNYGIGWIGEQNLDHMTQQNLVDLPAFMQDLMRKLEQKLQLSFADLQAKVGRLLVSDACCKLKGIHGALDTEDVDGKLDKHAAFRRLVEKFFCVHLDVNGL